MFQRRVGLPTLVACGLIALSETQPAIAADAVPAANAASQRVVPLYERFAPVAVATQLAGESDPQESSAGEIPDFQKHVAPLLGRLGCNGRACHGSFQGQGGFQLSLFGYDFKADYAALLEDGAARVDLDDKQESLILTKPVDEDIHDGGKRFEHGQWEYQVLKSWIDAGAPFESQAVQKLRKLQIVPEEINFSEQGESARLSVIAHWSDGTIEDVTCLARFKSNDASVAAIDEEGRVTAGQPGDTHLVVSYDNAVKAVQALRPHSDLVGDAYPDVETETEIDRLVVAKLEKLGIVPSEVSSDEEFLRRVSLDVTGTSPSPSEVVAFAEDESPDKRARKIEQLLAQPGYAAQWTTFLCDMTGNNEDQLRNFLPQSIDPSSHWYHWIYKRLEDNVPYDQIVEGIVTASSRREGESYADYCETMSDICRDKSGQKFADRPGLVYYWARRNFQTAEDRAIGFAYSFLGVRIQCAQCHKHPFDQWSKDDFDQFEKLFSNVQARQNSMYPDAKKEYARLLDELGVDSKLRGNLLRREFASMLKEGKVVPMPELVVSKPRAVPNKNNKGKGNAPQPPQARLLGGDRIAMDEADVRGRLMDWLKSPENPYFTKAIVNRVWAQYLGVGIVNPPDDLNLANAPSNAPLLDYLSDGFRDSGFDLKWLHREILNSATYQRSWVPNQTNALDKHNFSHGQLRRLPAETTYDAVRIALARDDVAEQYRALAVPRAITKPGASARNNRQDDESYALSVFGRSIRESNCDCDRSSEPSLLQTVFLANDSAVQQWLSDSKTSWVAQVADRYEWKKPKLSQADENRQNQLRKTLDRFAKQVQEADKRIVEAEQRGNPKFVRATKKRKADLVKRAQAVAKKNGLAFEAGAKSLDAAASPAEHSEMSAEQAEWIAEQAYLRTLSRKPDMQELSRVVAFLRADDNPSSAVEGLMWSLINTKEFILNH